MDDGPDDVPRRAATRRMLVVALVIGLVVAGGGVVLSSLQHDEPLASPSPTTSNTASVTFSPTPSATPVAAPSPHAFTRTTLARTYPSDSGTRREKAFTAELAGFAVLRRSHPEVLAAPTVVPADAPLHAANDEVAVAVNTGASDGRVQQAETDATTPAYLGLASGLGQVLGPIYADALAGGSLPKTRALLDGRVQQGWGSAVAKAAHPYPRPFVRLGFTTGGSCSSSTFEGQGRIVKADETAYDALCPQSSFPSGHANAAFLTGAVLATLLPELAPQIIDRAADLGESRIVLGVHYPLDVIGGRITGQATAARRWSDAEFRPLLEAAHRELEAVLAHACARDGHSATIVECAAEDPSFPSAAASRARYEQHADGGLPTVGPRGEPLVVPAGAGDLLRTAFPHLTAGQREAVLVATARDSGEPLDLSAEGGAGWERLDLAAALSAHVVVDSAGDVSVDGRPAHVGR